MRSESGIINFLLILPLVWMLNVLACFVYARYELGYWPRPYRPDPKDVVNGYFLVLSSFGLLYTLTLSPLIAIGYVIAGAMKKLRLSKVIIVGWVIPNLFFFCDKKLNWDLVEWILD